MREGPEGRYANFFEIGHNSIEFVLDFAQFYPDQGHAVVHTRIITNPVHARALMEVLSSSIRQYEREFGRRSSEGTPAVRKMPCYIFSRADCKEEDRET